MILILAIIAILLLNSFFAGIEIGMISILRPRLRHAAARGSTAAKLLERITAKPQMMLATTLLGNNLCTVLASVLSDQLFVNIGFDGTAALLWSTIIMTVLLMMSEIIPKNWFRQSPEERCITFAPFYFIFSIILWPGAKILSWITLGMLKLFSTSDINGHDNARNLLRRDFRLLLRDSEAAGSLDSGAADILDKSLGFSSLRVRNIYTPLGKLVTITHQAKIRDAITICRNSGKSRLPVIKNRDWIGFFSLYDAIYNIPDKKWDTLTVCDCMRVTETINFEAPISEVLKTSRRTNTRMIFVCDAKGFYIGVVTPTDVARKLFNRH